jgi:hypothetical protein
MNLSRFELHPPLSPDERALALRLTPASYGHRVARWTLRAVGLWSIPVVMISILATPTQWTQLGWRGATEGLLLLGALLAVLYGVAYERGAKRTWSLLRREEGLAEAGDIRPPSNER